MPASEFKKRVVARFTRLTAELKDYATPWEAETGLEAYFRFYDEERPHSRLGNRTPAEVYREGRSRNGPRVRVQALAWVD
jgi:transposase InsO family protein